MQELHKLQEQAGATFTEVKRPLTFSNDREALKAAHSGVALSDRLHWGLLKLAGDDRWRFLHNQTTNDINRLQPGQGCDTVFVTSTGRTIDLATVYVTEESILILVSPNRCQALMEWMDRFIFPFDQVELTDISAQTAIFTLLGSESSNLLQQLGEETILSQPEGNHTLVEIENTPVRVAVGSGLAIPGYTLILPLDKSAQIWSKLTAAGAVPMGDRAWETLRIQQGRPAPATELTEEYNPLEAGLWQAVSFEKGCYIGQETIARLNTYKGVKQRLWGVRLPHPVQPGTPVRVEDSKAGTITSCTATPQGAIALAYIRTKAGGAGLKAQVEETAAEIVDLPFVSHEYYQSQKEKQSN